MARTAALILFRSALFRDVFAKLMSSSASTVRTLPLPEAIAHPPDLGPETDVSVLVEVTDEEERLRERLRDLVCSYLFAANGKSLKVYFVDLRRNELIEYRRTKHETIDIFKEPAGANAS